MAHLSLSSSFLIVVASDILIHKLELFRPGIPNEVYCNKVASYNNNNYNH